MIKAISNMIIRQKVYLMQLLCLFNIQPLAACSGYRGQRNTFLR